MYNKIAPDKRRVLKKKIPKVALRKRIMAGFEYQISDGEREGLLSSDVNQYIARVR